VHKTEPRTWLGENSNLRQQPNDHAMCENGARMARQSRSSKVSQPVSISWVAGLPRQPTHTCSGVQCSMQSSVSVGEDLQSCSHCATMAAWRNWHTTSLTDSRSPSTLKFVGIGYPGAAYAPSSENTVQNSSATAASERGVHIRNMAHTTEKVALSRNPEGSGNFTHSEVSNLSSLFERRDDSR
jgi:hypothetical protein